MLDNFKIEQIAHRCFYLLNPGIAKFHHFSTIHTDEVIVLFVPVRFFILGEVFSKLMFGDKITTDEKFQRIVNSSAAYSVIGIFHMDIQSLCVEVISPVLNFFENCITLRRATKIILFKMP